MTELTKTTHRVNRDQDEEKLPLGICVAGWLAVGWAVVALLIDFNADKFLGR